MHSVRKINRSAEQQEARRRKEKVLIQQIRENEDKVLAIRQDADRSPDALKKHLEESAQLLRLYVENTTAWNIRRDLVQSIREKQLLLQELQFTQELLVHNPKVYGVWNYRCWVLDTLGVDAPWERELELVSLLLQKDGRNFHVWGFRRYVVSNLERYRGRSMVDEEFEYTTKSINSNYSNFSAMFNRTQLLKRKVQGLNNDEKLSLLRSEIEYGRSIVMIDPDDESGWLYYRFLLTGGVFKDLAGNVLSRELDQIKMLHAEEPGSSACMYSLHQLYKACWSAGVLTLSDAEYAATLNGLIDAMAAADPSRKERYYSLKRGHG